MSLKICPDPSFSTKFEKASLLDRIYQHLPEGVFTITGPTLLSEYGIAIPKSDYIGNATGIIRQINGKFKYTLPMLEVTNSGTLTERIIGSFNVELLNGVSHSRGEKEILHWALLNQPGILKVIFTNDKSAYFQATTSSIPVFRNGVILYVGVILHWWSEKEAKNIYDNVWVIDPQAVPKSCKTWKDFLTKYKTSLEENATSLIKISKVAHS